MLEIVEKVVDTTLSPVRDEIDDLSAKMVAYCSETSKELESLSSTLVALIPVLRKHLDNHHDEMVSIYTILEHTSEDISDLNDALRMLAEISKHAVLREPSSDSPKSSIIIGDVCAYTSKRIGKFRQWIISKLFGGAIVVRSMSEHPESEGQHE